MYVLVGEGSEDRRMLFGVSLCAETSSSFLQHETFATPYCSLLPDSE